MGVALAAWFRRSSGSSSSSRMAGGEVGVVPAAGWLEVKWE